MVYSNKFVAVVVCSDQIVREIRENGNDQVYLPFGSDYSLRFKNQHSTKAIVNVEIDGKNVLDGNQLVVDPNETSNLKGFMVNGKVNNAFRFIEKTRQIAEHRGDFIDDGFIRITWKFEEQFNNDLSYWIKNKSYSNPYKPRCGNNPWDDVVIGGSADVFCRGEITKSVSEPMASCNARSKSMMSTQNLTDFNKTNEGITVAGKDTYQNFRTVHVGQLEDVEHSIIIHLLGKDNRNQKITRPKMTHTKIECPTCGTRSKSHMKFCPSCGTNIKAVV